MIRNSYIKSHGLGNDYLFLDASLIDFNLNHAAITTICDVHYGVGSDGILLHVPSEKAEFGLRIFNPDGSEAEKSGNGLRIYCKTLYDHGYTRKKTFTVETAGGIINAEIVQEKDGLAEVIRIDMGRAIFESHNIPVDTDQPECMNFQIEAGGKTWNTNCLSVGNPHCVIFKDELDNDEIMQYGPLLENHERFPNRINVQFARVISPNEIEIRIWERGAGYTLASGRSSSAVACAAYKLGLTGQHVTIKMPGGSLDIEISNDWHIRMTGPVEEIATGTFSTEFINKIK